MKRRKKTGGRHAPGGESDPLALQHTKEELDSIRKMKAKLSQSNTGPDQNFSACIELGKESSKASKKNSRLRALLLQTAYRTYLAAHAAGELDQLRRKVKERNNKLRLGADPTILRALIRCARPELSAPNATKWASLLRLALRYDCQPDDLPGFLAKEGYRRGYDRLRDELKRERQPAESEAESDTEAETADDGDEAEVETASDQDEAEDDSELSGSSEEDETPDQPESPGAGDGDADAATIEVNLIPGAALLLDELTSEGLEGPLLLLVSLKQEEFTASALWRPKKDLKD